MRRKSYDNYIELPESSFSCPECGSGPFEAIYVEEHGYLVTDLDLALAGIDEHAALHIDNNKGSIFYGGDLDQIRCLSCGASWGSVKELADDIRSEELGTR